ncbi:hypothetical protein H8E77_17660 [bacterium]|nr:hypothetical protein [bacterium]
MYEPRDEGDHFKVGGGLVRPESNSPLWLKSGIETASYFSSRKKSDLNHISDPEEQQ